ncbi:MAG: hypothetical protein H7Y33_16965, partial [Cytophagales bacterium]|nr:hypothetical protein [Rhizobacter sp.]
NLKMNFVIKDGYVFSHNPNFKKGGTEPEYFAFKINPAEGQILHLSGGTNLYVGMNADGTMDLQITNVQESMKDPKGGILFTFPEVGSGKLIRATDYASGGVSGGKDAIKEWMTAHPSHGGKEGSLEELWVASMFDKSRHGEHKDARRYGGDSNSQNDPGQAPGGFSRRSTKKYDGLDQKDGVDSRHDTRWLWYDAKPQDTVDLNPVPGANPWQALATMNVRRDTVKAEAAAFAAANTLLMQQGDEGRQMFANPNADEEPGQEAILGGGKTSTDESSDSTATSTDDGVTSTNNDASDTGQSSKNAGWNARGLTLGEILASEAGLSYDSFTEEEEEEE